MICFLHAFSGCDTTSCFYKKGKNKLLEIVLKNKALHPLINSFYVSQTAKGFNTKKDEIKENTLAITMALYRAPPSVKTLSELRYYYFKKLSSSKNSSFKLESLPPTEAAAAQHGYRTFLQIQMWSINRTILATQYGRELNNEKVLIPVQSDKNMIPTNI